MKNIFLNEAQIKDIVKRLALEIKEKFQNDPLPPVVVGVIKGAVPFMTDLIQELDMEVLVDYIQISSYLGTESTGIIKFKKDIDTNVKGRKVIIIEDIVDSGYTLQWIKNYIESNHFPQAVYSCVLLDKKCKRKIPFKCDFIGLEIDDYFVCGYGLDYNEYFRNEKEIFIPTNEDLARIDKLNNK